MITERELDEAIAECLGQRKATAKTCIQLASFLDLKERLYGGTAPRRPDRKQSYAYASVDMMGSKSEFAEAVDGLPVDQAMHIVDEMMQTVKVMQPSLYDAYIRKLRQL